MTNVDALADAHYAAYDPQYADVEAEERADINDALDEVINTIETAVDELFAIRHNFTTRQYNRICIALEEIADELREEKTNYDEE